MKLKTREALQAHRALAAIAAADKKDSLTLNGVTRTKLARNLRRLRGAAEDFEDAHNGIVKQLGKFDAEINRHVVKGEAASEEYQKQADIMLDAEIELPLESFTTADFQIEKNKVPFDALADLNEAGLLPDLLDTPAN